MEAQQVLGLLQSFPSLFTVFGGVVLIGLIFYGALDSVRDQEKTTEQKDNDVFFFAIISAIMVLALMMMTLIVNK